MSTHDTDALAPDHGLMASTAIDAATFRKGMARVVASVHVVTTHGAQGDGGITATAVCPVSDTPSTVLVCLNRRSRAHDLVLANGNLAINALANDQKHLAAAFSGQGGLTMQERFALARWQRLVTGAPTLEGAGAVLDCDIERSESVGTHRIFICAVRAVRVGTAVAALIYGNHRFDDFSFQLP